MSHAAEILLGRLYHLGVNYFLLEAAFMITSAETTPDAEETCDSDYKDKG